MDTSVSETFGVQNVDDVMRVKLDKTTRNLTKAVLKY